MSSQKVLSTYLGSRNTHQSGCQLKACWHDKKTSASPDLFALTTLAMQVRMRYLSANQFMDNHDLRILLITDNHTPTGGAEHYFFDLKTRLKKIPGLDVFSLGFGPKEEVGEDYHVLKGLQSKTARLIWQNLLHPIVYLRLRRQIQAIRPDVIHLHNVKHYTASLLRAIKSYPTVQTIHDYGVVCPAAHNIHKDFTPCPTGMRFSCFWEHQVKFNRFIYVAQALSLLALKRRLKTRVAAFFAPSPLLVSYLKKHGFADSSYIAPFKQDNQPYAFEQINPYHFLFAGNLGRHKGIYTLLNEFALAHKQNNRLTLTIAGKGTEEHRLRQCIQALGLENSVTLIGWQASLSHEYATCAAVIFPSLWMEAFGLVITEAMSKARPVIGSDRGSVPWLVDDHKTGLVFNPLKTGDLAEKILAIAGNIALIKQLGTNGFTKLQTFIDNDAVLQEIIATYTRVIELSRH